ncbi:MAG TPA: hypothetical protein VLA04_06725 [Verrucomicrobiae bacterium]|nr:hypothetical protein [Verrucomicrobiae bacterium]
MTRFPTSETDSDHFFEDFFADVRRGTPSPEIATWLIENAKHMSERIFFQPTNDWNRLEPHHVLALRACTPLNVFTPTAKGGYLTQVADNAALASLASVMFGSDYDFLTNLPDEYRYLQPELTQLTILAYRHKVRSGDARVHNLR